MACVFYRSAFFSSLAASNVIASGNIFFSMHSLTTASTPDRIHRLCNDDDGGFRIVGTCFRNFREHEREHEHYLVAVLLICLKGRSYRFDRLESIRDMTTDCRRQHPVA